MDQIPLELIVYLENQLQLNYIKSLVSNTGTSFALQGRTVFRTLKSLTLFTEGRSGHRIQTSKKGIPCSLEYHVHGHQLYVASLTITFSNTSSSVKLVSLPENLLAVPHENEWELLEHAWSEVHINLRLELNDADAGPSSPREAFLPTPLYHFLSELLRDDSVSIPPLQIGLIKLALLSLRSGSKHQLPFYGDIVLNSICRDILFPLTRSAILPNDHEEMSVPYDGTSPSPSSSHSPSPVLSRAVFHGPSGTGKSKIARFLYDSCGFRGIFCGTPSQLNRAFNEDRDLFRRVVNEQLSVFPLVPCIFVLDRADDDIPPLGSLPFLLPYLTDVPNLLFVAITEDVRTIDKAFFRNNNVTQIYFPRLYAQDRMELLANLFHLRGFLRAASVLRSPLAREVHARLHKLTCGRTGGQLIAMGEACVRRCALDDSLSVDPVWDFVLPRLERAFHDVSIGADWSPDEEVPPPELWNEVVLSANNQLSGRMLCDAAEGKLIIEFCDGKVHPLWLTHMPGGPCFVHQLALGIAASVVEPSTVVIIDSRRQELIAADAEASVGYATLSADMRNAGLHGGALVVLDMDDLVGVSKDTSSRVLLINRHIQDPVHKYDSIKLLREHIMHKVISFSASTAFVKDFAERSFCIVLAVTRDPFLRDRMTAAWHLNVHIPFETSFIPRGLHVSQSIIVAQDEDEDAAGCVCATLGLQAGASYVWMVQVFIASGFVSLGVVHSSVNTLAGRFQAGVIGESYGSWGFRITANSVEVSQSVPSKLILSPLPEAHENPTRSTVRNNRAVFGVYLQATSHGNYIHLLRFVNQQDAANSNQWEHVAFKRIDSLDGLSLMPAFGIAKKFSSLEVIACHQVSSSWFPCDALPDMEVNPAFVTALRNANAVTLFKGGLHINASSIYWDKTRIATGKKAIVRFHVHEKAPQAPVTLRRELTRTHNSGMNMLFQKILPDNTPRLVIGFIKESEVINNPNLSCYNILGYNPNLARCYYGHNGERDVPSLGENPQKAGLLYINLCPTSPYCGSIHYFKIRALGNVMYCGSLIEGISSEAYRAAISFDDTNTEQGRALATFGTATLGGGLDEELLPQYVPEWYPLDYRISQGVLSFSPDPNTVRQEKDGMNSRFTKELTPANADWHYIECRSYSCTGASQVIVGFISSDDLSGTIGTHVGARGTSGFGYSVHNGETFLGSSGVTRANTKFGVPPKDYIRVGLLLSVQLGEVHLFWAEVGAPGPIAYKGLLFENVSDAKYRFVISASHAGTTVSWRGFACSGSLPQAKASVATKILDFHEVSGNVAYASRGFVMFPGMDIIGDDISVLANATPQELRKETTRRGAGGFTSSGTIKDYHKIYQRMRIVDNRVEIAGLTSPVCSDFCLRVHVDGYVFIPQHDAVGDEIDTEHSDLLAVAHRCTQDRTALAFNTGGVIKHSLTKWVLYLADPGATGCFTGIFVKVQYLCRWLGTTDSKKCQRAIRALVCDRPHDSPALWSSIN